MKIEMTDEQAKALSNASETISRLLMGQFNEIKYMFLHKDIDFGELDVVLLRLEKVIFPNGRIVADREYSSILWDIYQVLRWHLAYKRDKDPTMTRDWKTQITVDYDEPRKMSKEPFIKIEDNYDV